MFAPFFVDENYTSSDTNVATVNGAGHFFADVALKKGPPPKRETLDRVFNLNDFTSQQVHRSRWASMGSGTSGSGRCWRGRQLSAGTGAEAVAADSRPYARSDR